jgi:hypothetical protein
MVSVSHIITDITSFYIPLIIIINIIVVVVVVIQGLSYETSAATYQSTSHYHVPKALVLDTDYGAKDDVFWHNDEEEIERGRE